MAFKPKLSDCTPQAKFLATQLIVYKIFIRNKCQKEHDVFWKLEIIANQEKWMMKWVITNLNNPLKPASGWRKKHRRPLDFLLRRRSVKKHGEKFTIPFLRQCSEGTWNYLWTFFRSLNSKWFAWFVNFSALTNMSLWEFIL